MQSQVSAILLAAGSGRRMGQVKQLLPIGNRPIIGHCAGSIIQAGIRDIVVVTGQEHENIQKALLNLPVRLVRNPHLESEMAESVRTGLREIDTASTGVLVCLSDHPLISPETYRTLVRIHAERPDKIIIPLYNARRGHPVLFPAGVIEWIFLANSLREIINKNSEKTFFIDVPDEGVVLDMDTPEDYQKITISFRK